MSDSLFSDAEQVGQWLERHFALENVAADRLREAMGYAALNGGKRLRGCLVISSARCVSAITGTAVDMDTLLAIAGAVELLHAYSLIHDDLPAMDDAELRRGKPATHIAFDEATAILAGDALQTQAFSILASDRLALPAHIKITLVAMLADASGLAGMAGGQMLDLQAQDRMLDMAEIRQMQDLKTGALIRASVLMGAQAQGATDQMLAALASYADKLGYAFQIADDLLDALSDAEQLGKPAGRDAEQNKASLVSLLGLEEAKQVTARLALDAENLLDPFGSAADELVALARFAVSRSY
jgi:geranylgeranyl pyrophosphate synthase